MVEVAAVVVVVLKEDGYSINRKHLLQSCGLLACLNFIYNKVTLLTPPKNAINRVYYTDYKFWQLEFINIFFL